jgi:hypothetical protein
MSGISQLDPFVAQAEQHISQQQMPPDKAVEYLLSKGVDPRLASLVMKYRMLKQSAGTPQAPTKTVSQEIDDKVNSMATQRQQGVAGLSVPNQMFGAATPATKGMAGGGIVAFADEGLVEDPSSYGDFGPDPIPAFQSINNKVGAGVAAIPGMIPGYDALQAAQQMQNAHRFGAGPTGRYVPQNGAMGVAPPGATIANVPKPQPAPAPQIPPAQRQPDTSTSISASASSRRPGSDLYIPPGMQSELDRQQQEQNDIKQGVGTVQSHTADVAKAYEEQGIGAAAKTHLAYLDKLQSQLGDFEKKGKWLALIQMGSAISEAATNNPHGGYLGALAAGGKAGAEAYTKNMNEYRDLNMKMNEAKYQVQQQQEMIKAGMVKEGNADYKDAVARYDAYAGRTSASRMRAVEAVYGKEIATDVAKINAQNRIKYPGSVDTEAFNEMSKYPVGSPQYQATLQRYTDLRGASSQVQGADIRAGAGAAAARQRLMTNPTYVNLVQQAQRVDATGAPTPSAISARKTMAALEARESGQENSNQPTPVGDYLKNQGF